MCSIQFLQDHINTRIEYELAAVNRCCYIDINGTPCHHLEKIGGRCIKHYIAKLCLTFYNEYLSVINSIKGYTICGHYNDVDNPGAVIYCYILTERIGQKTTAELATLAYYEKEIWIPDQSTSYEYNLYSTNSRMCVFENNYKKILEEFSSININDSGIIEKLIDKAADMGLLWQ